MASFADRIAVIIDGNAAGFVRAANTAGGSSTALGTKTSKLEGGLKSLGLQGMSTGALLGTGLAVGVGAAAAVGAKAVSDFANLTEEIYKLQNASGATAEEASALIAVADDFNISAQGLTRSVGFLGKGLGLGTTDLSNWGIEVAKNADGSTDLMETVLRIGDAYRSTGDQTERNALVMKAFGRSGQELVPILQQDRAALEEFLASAEETGQIFNQADIDKGLELRLALDQAGDAVKGLSLDIGSALAPVVTDAATGLAGLVGIVDSGAGALGNMGAASDALLSRALPVVGALDDFGTIFSDTADGGDRAASAIDAVTLNVADLSSIFGESEPKASAFEESQNAVAEAQAKVAEVASDASASEEDLTAAQDELSAAQGEFTGVAEDVTDALMSEADAAEIARQSMVDLQNAQLAQLDADLAFGQSKMDLAGAQGEYNEALRLANEAGGTNLELNGALALAEAAYVQQIRDHALAAGAVAAATMEGATASEQAAAGNAATAFSMLQLAGTMAPGSPLRASLEETANSMIEVGKPRTARIITEVIQAGGSVEDLIGRLVEAEKRREARIEGNTTGIDGALARIAPGLFNLEKQRTVPVDADASAADAEIDRINNRTLTPKTLDINVRVNDPTGALSDRDG